MFLRLRIPLRRVIALVLVSFLLSGCVVLTEEFNTENLWEAENISQRRINYTGSVSKITIGNIRPTIPGKSKKHLDKKFDIKIHYEIKNKQSRHSSGDTHQCFDLFSNNKCFVITVRAERADEEGTKRLIKKIKNLPLDSINLYVENQNDEMKIKTSMCSRNGNNVHKVPHILEANLSSMEPPSGVYCMSFRQSIYEYELSLSQRCEENKDDVVMLDHAIPVAIKEQCTLYKTDVTAGKVLATPFAVGADILNIPIILMMMW